MGQRHGSGVRPLFTFALMSLVVAVLVWHDQPDRGRLHVFFLDTPGDAALIQSPQGGYVLIDGGTDPSRLAMGLGEHLPFWRRTLDAVILTRGDEARLPGQVAALSRYRPSLVIAPAPLWQGPYGGESAESSRTPGGSIENQTYLEEWWSLIASNRLPVSPVRSGHRLSLDGLTMSVVPTGAGDGSGLVLRLDYGATSVVFAGAISGADDTALLERDIARPVTVVAYPWERGMDTPLLARWQPQELVFTTGLEQDPPALLTYAERKRYGSGARLYHPELDGTIEVVSDGRRAWVVRGASDDIEREY
jgi:beta-lactamase superfamily II metal-dependent hydrolase